MKSNRFTYPSFGFGSGFGRLIQDAFEGLDDLGGVFRRPAGGGPVPSADLFEDDRHFYVVTELPGVAKSDLRVELAEGVLNISATVSRETADGRKNLPLKRAVALPDQVGDGEIRAKLADGILTVTLPKAAAARPRSIEIE